MSELIKFRAYDYNDEKIDTFTFNPDKDMKVTTKNKKIKIEVDTNSDFGRFIKNKVQ